MDGLGDAVGLGDADGSDDGLEDADGAGDAVGLIGEDEVGLRVFGGREGGLPLFELIACGWMQKSGNALRRKKCGGSCISSIGRKVGSEVRREGRQVDGRVVRVDPTGTLSSVPPSTSPSSSSVPLSSTGVSSSVVAISCVADGVGSLVLATVGVMELGVAGDTVGGIDLA